MEIFLQRIYEDDEAVKGYRVLVDRLWPRGISREKASLDEWNKDLAPSTELRKWFGHEPRKWKEFSKRYRSELQQNRKEACDLLDRSGNRLVLLYGAKNKECTHALVLKRFLDDLRRLRGEESG